MTTFMPVTRVTIGRPLELPRALEPQPTLRGRRARPVPFAGDAGQRMANLAKHLLGQRSHMPMFPAAKNFPLDLSRVESANMVATPDVLLLPSDLKFMAPSRALAS